VLSTLRTGYEQVVKCYTSLRTRGTMRLTHFAKGHESHHRDGG